MAVDEVLVQRLRRCFYRKRSITEKRMFGGVGYLLKGNLFVGVWKDSLIARIGPHAYEQALENPFVREFDITGRAMKGWVLVGPEQLNDEQLDDWIDLAMQFVKTLPAK